MPQIFAGFLTIHRKTEEQKQYDPPIDDGGKTHHQGHISWLEQSWHMSEKNYSDT